MHNSILSCSSVVEYNFTMFHEDNSDAHAMNVQVLWMFPTYTKFLQVNRNSHQLNVIRLKDNVMFEVCISLIIFSFNYS